MARIAISNQAKIITLFSSQVSPARPNQRIVIRQGSTIHVISSKDILRIEADGNYSKIFMTDGTEYIQTTVLKNIESKLPTDIFLRIHQSHLVNGIYITQVLASKKIQLINGELLPLSRRKKHKLLHFLAYTCTQLV